MATVPENVGSIIVRVPNWIGDAVMCLPALAALGRAFPGARVDVLVRSKLAGLFGLVPGLRRVVVTDHNPGFNGLARLVRGLRAERYDLGVVLNNSFRAAALMRLAGPRVSVGYATELRSPLLDVALPFGGMRAQHQSADYNALVRAVGAEVPDVMDVPVPMLRVRPDDRQWARALIRENFKDPSLPLVGVNPGASYGAAKCWPAGDFSLMLKKLGERLGFNAVLFGGPGEREVSAAVMSGLEGGGNAPRALDMGGRTSLGQLLALLESCALVVSNDTGPMHLAAALGRPVLALFGSTLPDRSRPLGQGSVVIWKHVPCSPCFKRVCPLEGGERMRCMREITVSEAVEACAGLLGRAAAGGRGT